jgi:hypothetical protein
MNGLQRGLVKITFLAGVAVDGSANYLTAAICKLTGNQPASACTPAVKALEAKL